MNSSRLIISIYRISMNRRKFAGLFSRVTNNRKTWGIGNTSEREASSEGSLFRKMPTDFTVARVQWQKKETRKNGKCSRMITKSLAILDTIIQRKSNTRRHGPKLAFVKRVIFRGRTVKPTWHLFPTRPPIFIQTSRRLLLATRERDLLPSRKRKKKNNPNYNSTDNTLYNYDAIFPIVIIFKHN